MYLRHLKVCASNGQKAGFISRFRSRVGKHIAANFKGEHIQIQVGATPYKIYEMLISKRGQINPKGGESTPWPPEINPEKGWRVVVIK
jgi:hypothetical protein